MPSFFSNPTILLGSFAVVVCAAVALFVWLRAKKKAAASKSASAEARPLEPAAAGGSDPVHAIFRAANARLAVSQKMKGASLSSLPAFLVIGPKGVGKTSAVLQSGLDPELLAGQVHQGVDIVPTTLNVWLARQVLFIEVSQSLATDPQAFQTILKYLRPTRLSAMRKKQPAHAILLCEDQKTVAESGDPQQIAAAVRPWNQCLSLAAATLGTQLPVYVLFTKLDGVSGFPEFVSRLTPKDMAQAIGATMRPFDPSGQGVYADETASLVDNHFTRITGALCDSRVPLLIREQDHARIAVEYQFPRDFQKLQKNLVANLVALAKPSQLQISAFLRGFYFSGTRQVALQPGEGRALPVAPASVRPEAVGATVLLSPEQLKTQMSMLAKPSQGPNETTEWLFLAKLFEQVLLQDRTAHAVSTRSSRAGRMRDIAFGAAGALTIVLLVAFTISYLRNRKLERDLAAGAVAIQSPSSSDALENLELMRAPIDSLLEYRLHRPWLMRLGLYRGAELLPYAQAIYCTAINPILKPAVDEMADRLASMPNAGGDPSVDIDLFKAYLMMTASPGKSDETILRPQLIDAWKRAARSAGSQQPPPLLDAELRSYAALLPISDFPNSCTFAVRQDSIPKARAYLCGSNLDDTYRTLLRRAGQGLDVDYNSQFKNDAVSDAKTIPGGFTRAGWKKMQDFLQHPETSLKVDAWVCGAPKDRTQEDLLAEANRLRERYRKDYVQNWTDYLTAANVATYKSLDDAVAKLDQISGERCYLLALLGLAADNTAFTDQLKMFQPLTAVSSNTADFQTAKNYKQKLDLLKNRLKDAAQSKGAIHDQDVQQVRTAAAAAEDAIVPIESSPGFQGDIGGLVKQVLLKPIKPIDRLLDEQVEKDVNRAGRGLCSAYNQLAHRLPFASGTTESESPPEEVQRMFQPETGQIWQFYNQSLRDSLDCGVADCVSKSNAQFVVSRPFVNFLSGMKHWTRLLYGGSQGISIRLKVRALGDKNLRQLEIKVDDQVTLLAGGLDQTVNWEPGRSHRLQVTGMFDNESVNLFGPSDGHWEIFSWLWDAKPMSGGEFTWRPTSGKINALKLSNGNPTTYRLRIQLDDGSPLSLPSSPCVVPTGR
jgi:type VI secretion system protein ImpL